MFLVLPFFFTRFTFPLKVFMAKGLLKNQQGSNTLHTKLKEALNGSNACHLFYLYDHEYDFLPQALSFSTRSAFTL